LCEVEIALGVKAIIQNPRIDWNIAKLAEKAKTTSIFFADTYAGHDVYGGNMDALFRAGTQVAQLDPLVIISAMAVSKISLYY
jgi:alkanesulfonate monooxygenase SsuD/methylene tetrahydromethanopterin reductase-like flavin-dependent oxidoreductase (luciferase family)